MAGTLEGGRAAARTNKAKYGEDFYGKIGALGGKKGKTGGFYANRELARLAGAKGGRNGSRSKNTRQGVCIYCERTYKDLDRHYLHCEVKQRQDYDQRGTQ